MRNLKDEFEKELEKTTILINDDDDDGNDNDENEDKNNKDKVEDKDDKGKGGDNDENNKGYNEWGDVVIDSRDSLIGFNQVFHFILFF